MTDRNEVAIAVKDLHKSFRLPHERYSGIKQKLIGMFRQNRKKGYEMQHVLTGLSFEIEKGDFFGIVGRNGSGKSTLLKTLAGIYSPDKGLIQTSGTLVPFIELGVGFNPELTGRENVYLNGALLGFSRDEMMSMYDDIVEFAELERFMDQKLKNYSSGMQVRLAFSIAIRADADILLLDEVLAVGDEAFQRKCYSYFAELKKEKKTVILVTHDMDSVQRFCNKAILIEKGEIIDSGYSARVAGKYLELNNTTVHKKRSSDTTLEPASNGISAKVKMKNIGSELVFAIDVHSTEQIDDAIVTFMINRDTGEAVYRWATERNIPKVFPKNNATIRLRLSLENIFPDGEYDIQLAVKKSDRSMTYALFNNILAFSLVNDDVTKRDIHWKPKEKINYEQT